MDLVAAVRHHLIHVTMRILTVYMHFKIRQERLN